MGGEIDSYKAGSQDRILVYELLVRALRDRNNRDLCVYPG